MATPVAAAALRFGDDVGNESIVAGFDIGNGQTAMAVYMFGKLANGSAQAMPVTADGVSFVPSPPQYLFQGGALGLDVAGSATVSFVEDEEVVDYQWVLGSLRFTQDCTIQFIWHDTSPLDTDNQIEDDVVTLDADDSYKPDTPRRNIYLTVKIVNLSASPGVLYGWLGAENSGAV